MIAAVQRFALVASLTLATASFALAAAPAAVNDAAITGEALPAKLSEFGFFTDLPARTPAARLFRYELNTPLFSDYSEKQRYLYIPPGQQARFDPRAPLILPVGAAIIKTFGYEMSDEQGRATFQPLETRLLLHRASGWVALPYVWNADLSDAVLKRAGTRLPVTFTDPGGQAHTISYAVPNQNQCKGCHDVAGTLTPIGPTARNLNRDRQLERMVATSLLDRAPAVTALARWDDPTAPLDARARAYLEVNCAHCHSAKGPASNSGLFFDHDQSDPVMLGIGKRPVAAGRGSAGREFAIARGDPAGSILIARMESVEPGVAMPELGRATVHREGVALLSQWIANMSKSGPAPARRE